MTERDRIIALLKAADITQDDWLWDITHSITDQFARGYLARLQEEMNGNIPGHDEEYRENLIEACLWSIWEGTK